MKQSTSKRNKKDFFDDPILTKEGEDSINIQEYIYVHIFTYKNDFLDELVLTKEGQFYIHICAHTHIFVCIYIYVPIFYLERSVFVTFSFYCKKNILNILYKKQDYLFYNYHSLTIYLIPSYIFPDCRNFIG